MIVPVFDLHCDTATKLADNGWSLRKNEAHIDLDRVAGFAGYAQCFACFTTYQTGMDSERCFREQLNAVFRELARNSTDIRLARNAEDIERNQNSGRMSAVLTIEGTCGISCDPSRLEMLRETGFLITTLGWNEKNPLTGSCVTGGGLTARGRDYVREAQRLGMVVDVSHISDEGFWDIVNITTAPVVATHSNSRAVRAHRRNLTDEMFRAIVQTGGTVGINLCADFLGDDPDVDTVCDHIFHFLELDQAAKHISLGGDLDGIDVMPRGVRDMADYPRIADRLLQRGVSEQTVYDIFWNNALDVLKRV